MRLKTLYKDKPRFEFEGTLDEFTHPAVQDFLVYQGLMPEPETREVVSLKWWQTIRASLLEFRG